MARRPDSRKGAAATAKRDVEVASHSSSISPEGQMLADLAKAHAALRASTAELRGHKKELEQVNSWIEIALNNMDRGLSMFDAEQRLIVCNRAYRQIYDLPEWLTQPGTAFAEIVRYHVKRETGRDGPEDIENERRWIARHVADLARGRSFSYTQTLSTGRTIVVSNQPMAGGGWVDLQEDITERRRREAEIEYLARHDALTGLPNRTSLHERLDQALKTARRGEAVAVLCLDLDHFKEVNDTFGHPMGDQLLKAVAKRLRNCVRDSDTVSRVSGDGFVVVQICLDPSKEAAALASRISEAIGAPYDFNGHQVVIGISIGIAISPRDGTDSTALMKNADMALFRSKTEGRGTYSFFEEEMNVRMQARRDLERSLRTAILNREFELHYQPLINLERNEVSGFEALVRWRSPERGIVSPEQFIPLAEETGLILQIGEWVLQQACLDAATWPDHVTVAVNLSTVQCKSRALVQTVLNALATAGLPAQRLELEITETVLMQDPEATLANLRQLRDLGVRIALDDFGTGYSSLSYLQSFPFDKIKIDRSFIKDLYDEDSRSLPIVRAVAQLGRAFSMSITAEGVETKEQLARARAEGCTEIQGYFFSRPMPAKHIMTQFFQRADRLAKG